MTIYHKVIFVINQICFIATMFGLPITAIYWIFSGDGRWWFADLTLFAFATWVEYAKDDMIKKLKEDSSEKI